LSYCCWSLALADETTCGGLKNGFGPFDYRTAKPSDLQIVEDYHFTQDVETLRHGSTGAVGGDLDYTLRAFPNHHRALVSMMNLQFKIKADHAYGAKWSVPCYFDRALRFRPDDPTVHTIFGVYLLRLGKTKEAIAEFQNAVTLGDDSGSLHYNLGLAYFNINDYDKAVDEAKKASERGFNLPGLKEKLRKASKWPAE
jgi:tetratricopeptide (TPR) repeat protein